MKWKPSNGSSPVKSSFSHAKYRLRFLDIAGADATSSSSVWFFRFSGVVMAEKKHCKFLNKLYKCECFVNAITTQFKTHVSTTWTKIFVFKIVCYCWRNAVPTLSLFRIDVKNEIPNPSPSSFLFTKICSTNQICCNKTHNWTVLFNYKFFNQHSFWACQRGKRFPCCLVLISLHRILWD